MYFVFYSTQKHLKQSHTDHKQYLKAASLSITCNFTRHFKLVKRQISVHFSILAQQHLLHLWPL